MLISELSAIEKCDSPKETDNTVDNVFLGDVKSSIAETDCMKMNKVYYSSSKPI